MKKNIISVVLLSLAFATAAGAAPADFQFGLAFSPALPQGEFHDVLGRTVWGGTFLFAWRPSRSPVLLGTSLGFGIYGSKHWEDWLGLTDPDGIVDVRTTNAVLAWYIFLRLQPKAGFLRPYLDVFAGLHILSTDTRIGNGNSYDDSSGDFSVNNALDSAFAFGAGAGVMLSLVRFVRRDGQTVASIDLDFGARYARGGRADYQVESGEPGVYESRTSRTDLLTLNAGLSFNF
ncbi:MAG: hypothetical protein ACYDH3_06980 [Candidatus Aminicenantales bacterium]